MNISVLLTNKEVSCWNFSNNNAQKLTSLLNGNAIVKVFNDPDKFAATLPATDVAISWRFSQEWVDNSPKLKILATPAAGMDYFSLNLPQGMQMLYGTFHGKIMAETVMGMMLDHCRGISRAAKLMKGDEAWPRRKLDATNRLIRGSNVLILGFGRIGEWIGRYAKSLGATVTGVRRNVPEVNPDYFTKNDGIYPVEKLDELLPDADHLVIVLPASEQTDNIISDMHLSRLPAHCGIYNIGRGNAIDEKALVSHLHLNPECCAYLDVFQHEPLAEDSPLRSLENVLLMPHASAVSPEYLDYFVDDLAPKLLKIKEDGNL